MELDPNVRRLAEDNGFDAADIVSKVDRVEEVVDERGLSRNATVVPYFDMNGPIVDKDSVDFSVHNGVGPAVKLLDSVSEVSLSMLSGWDINTLQFVAEDRLGVQMDYVGELGGTALIDGELPHTVDTDYSAIEDFRREMWLEAASEEIVLHEQGNIGAVVGCTYSQGVRSDLYKHPVAEASRVNFSTEDFYETLIEEGSQETSTRMSEGGIEIDLSPDSNVHALSKTVTNHYPLLGLRYESVGDSTVRFTEDSKHVSGESDEEYLNDFHSFMDRVTEGTPFDPDHNPDFCTDYIDRRKGVSKEKGANYRAERVTEGEHILFNVGDKPGDILEGENSIFFAQQDMTVMDETQNIDKTVITVDSAADYALTVTEYIKRCENQ